MEDFLYSDNTRIDFNELFHEIFTKILAAQKKSEKLILLLNCQSRVDLECPKNTVFKNFCSLRMLKGAGCEEVYTNLFETSSAWQVFKVGVSSKT